MEKGMEGLSIRGRGRGRLGRGGRGGVIQGGWSDSRGGRGGSDYLKKRVAVT